MVLDAEAGAVHVVCLDKGAVCLSIEDVSSAVPLGDAGVFLCLMASTGTLSIYSVGGWVCDVDLAGPARPDAVADSSAMDTSAMDASAMDASAMDMSSMSLASADGDDAQSRRF